MLKLGVIVISLTRLVDELATNSAAVQAAVSHGDSCSCFLSTFLFTLPWILFPVAHHFIHMAKKNLDKSRNTRSQTIRAFENTRVFVG